MASIEIKFTYPDGAKTFTYSVDDKFVPDMAGALAAHDKHGFVVETKTVQVEEGQDENGNPILVDREVTTRNPATFEQAVESWSAVNVRDAIVSAVNDYRVAKAQAQALAAVNVPPIVAE